MLVKKIVTVGTLAICLHAEQLVLQDGTPIRLRLNRNVSSADAKVGETIDFEVLDDIKVKEAIVAKRGGIALATVTQAQEKRRMGKAGKLDIVNTDALGWVISRVTGKPLAELVRERFWSRLGVEQDA